MADKNKRTRLVKIRDHEFQRILNFKEKNHLNSMGEALNRMIKIFDGEFFNKKRRFKFVDEIEF